MHIYDKKTIKTRPLICYLCFRSLDTSLGERFSATISLYSMVQVELTELDLIIRFTTSEKRKKRINRFKGKGM